MLFCLYDGYSVYNKLVCLYGKDFCLGRANEESRVYDEKILV